MSAGPRGNLASDAACEGAGRSPRSARQAGAPQLRQALRPRRQVRPLPRSFLEDLVCAHLGATDQRSEPRRAVAGQLADALVAHAECPRQSDSAQPLRKPIEGRERFAHSILVMCGLCARGNTPIDWSSPVLAPIARRNGKERRSQSHVSQLHESRDVLRAQSQELRVPDHEVLDVGLGTAHAGRTKLANYESPAGSVGCVTGRVVVGRARRVRASRARSRREESGSRTRVG